MRTIKFILSIAILLIEPQGIEMMYQMGSFQDEFLLIEPQGIEISKRIGHL